MSSEQDELLRLAIENERLRAQLKANEEAAAALREDRKERIERQILALGTSRHGYVKIEHKAWRSDGHLRAGANVWRLDTDGRCLSDVWVGKEDVPFVAQAFARINKILGGAQ